LLNVACSAAALWSTALNTAFFACRGEFYNYFGLCRSALIREQTFLHTQQKEGSSETRMRAHRLLHCQESPPHFRAYGIDGEDATGDVCLQKQAISLRLRHKNISFCSTEVQRPL